MPLVYTHKQTGELVVVYAYKHTSVWMIEFEDNWQAINEILSNDVDINYECLGEL